MNSDYKRRPLELWSNPTSGKVDAKALKPFGSIDSESGAPVSIGKVATEAEPKTPPPAAPGPGRLQDQPAVSPAAAPTCGARAGAAAWAGRA